MSWPDITFAGHGPTPAPGIPLRELILGALAEAVITRRAAAAFCNDCHPARLCPDHRADHDLATQLDNAYTQVAMGSREWADLVTGLTGALN